MSKLSAVIAAFLVPALAVSVASAAPKKKKKHKSPPPAAAATVAPPPAVPAKPDPVLDAKPKSSALQRVENGIASYTPPDAPTPVISPKQAEKPVPTSTTSLTSASVPAAPRAQITAASPDVVASPVKRDPLAEGISVAPIVDFGTSKAYGLGVG